MNGPNPVSASDALHHCERYALVFHYVPLIDTTLPPSARAQRESLLSAVWVAIVGADKLRRQVVQHGLGDVCGHEKIDGRVKGARNKLSGDFVSALSRAFDEMGEEAIRIIAKEEPVY